MSPELRLRFEAPPRALRIDGQPALAVEASPLDFARERERFDAVAAAVTAAAARMKEAALAELARCESSLVDLALLAAEKVLLREWSEGRLALRGWFEQAFEELKRGVEKASAVHVLVNPRDHARFAVLLGEDFARRTPLAIVDDPAVAEGGCVLKNDLKQIRFGLEEAFARVRAAALPEARADA